MPLHAVLYVQRLEELTSFYATGFTLDVAEATEGFAELAGDGFTFTLVGVPLEIAEQIGPAATTIRRSSNPVKIGFEVADLDEARARLATLGGDPLDHEHPWTFRGVAFADCLDPEGNVIQLRQRLIR